MLYAEFDTKNRGRKSFDWHVGDKIPASIQHGEDTCRLLQADGHELEWIKANISGIPMSKNPVVSWTGDFAQFIIMSLR